MNSTINAGHPLLLPLRLTGVAAALLNLALLGIFLFANPYGTGGATVLTYVVIVLLMIVALAAAWASWQTRPRVLGIAFLLGFLPYGCWFLSTPGIFRLIGAATLLYLPIAVALFILRRRH